MKRRKHAYENEKDFDKQYNITYTNVRGLKSGGGIRQEQLKVREVEKI